MNFERARLPALRCSLLAQQFPLESPAHPAPRCFARCRCEVDRGVLDEEVPPFPVDAEEEVGLRLVRMVGRKLLAA